MRNVTNSVCNHDMLASSSSARVHAATNCTHTLHTHTSTHAHTYTHAHTEHTHTHTHTHTRIQAHMHAYTHTHTHTHTHKTRSQTCSSSTLTPLPPLLPLHTHNCTPCYQMGLFINLSLFDTQIHTCRGKERGREK